MAAVLQFKINNYIIETRISFLHSDNRKNLTWVFIRMFTIVTSSDMTSYIYIGDEKHHLSKWLGKKKKWPPAKRNWAIFIEWLKKAKTNCKRCWINQATVMQLVQETILLRGSTENIQRSCRKTSTSARGDRIILWTGKLNRSQPSADPVGGAGVPDPPPPWKITSYLGFYRE